MRQLGPQFGTVLSIRTQVLLVLDSPFLAFSPTTVRYAAVRSHDSSENVLAKNKGGFLEIMPSALKNGDDEKPGSQLSNFLLFRFGLLKPSKQGNTFFLCVLSF